MLRKFPPRSNADGNLRRLASSLPPLLGIQTDYETGYALAVAVREHLGNTSGYLDIEALLKGWGVRIETTTLSHGNVDGGAVWDSDHGPVIVVNAQSPRSSVQWGRRMVLAHELCHLLVDRNQAGRLEIMSTPFTPPVLERRANAFAAELLLPRAGILSTVGDPSLGLGDADMKTLRSTFEVGVTTCSWHVQNRFHLPS